jgi:hypothetical protein
VEQLILVEEHAGFVVKNEEEAKHLLRFEVGDLLHALVMQNPDLRNWAVSVQDCVYGMLEGETKVSCVAVYSEHIGDETKHAVWRIVERILFTTRCKVIASQEVDEIIAKFRIKIYDIETYILMVTSSVWLLSFYLPMSMAIIASIVGFLYSALVVWLKRRSPLFLEWLKTIEVRKRTLACLNKILPGILSEIRKIRKSLNRRLSS